MYSALSALSPSSSHQPSEASSRQDFSPDSAPPDATPDRSGHLDATPDRATVPLMHLSDAHAVDDCDELHDGGQEDGEDHPTAGPSSQSVTALSEVITLPTPSQSGQTATSLPPAEQVHDTLPAPEAAHAIVAGTGSLVTESLPNPLSEQAAPQAETGSSAPALPTLETPSTQVLDAKAGPDYPDGPAPDAVEPTCSSPAVPETAPNHAQLNEPASTGHADSEPSVAVIEAVAASVVEAAVEQAVAVAVATVVSVDNNATEI